ncbi:CHRD domain-containing protein [Bacillus toyonensis]|uniref:CHRD domain-containing protein n=1 Tax=Bacillus toyonensis TaxID=155322 RepID=UPI000BF0CDDB|nr:CHRD domain-containing protein [Bacillus toyonensis]PEM46680.1 CHRD domain-containing protein [Bacillus toyonensis]PHE90199.1 CHRD domain-containing protein [Bacillus toyonensis]
MANFYFAELSGDHIVPPVLTTATGFSAFSFNDNFTLLNFVIRVNEVNKLKAANLRFGTQNTNRSIVTILFESCTRSITVNPGTVSGTVMNTDLIGPLSGRNLIDLARQMELGHIYVSIASEKYPTGEISGKLIPAV